MGDWTDSETERDESILDSNLECSFLPTQEEMELFLAADDDSTDELDYHSNEYTEDTSVNDRTAISSSNPQNGIESINGMGTCPVRSNTMAVSSSSVKIEVPETKKIAMLVDSREVTTSQVRYDMSYVAIKLSFLVSIFIETQTWSRYKSMFSGS